MKFRALVCLFVSFAVAGCQAGDIGKAKAAVSRDLKDPGSSQFRDLYQLTRATDGGGEIKVVCGEVNSKNGYGAYAGYSPFFYVIKHTGAQAKPDGAHAVLNPGHFELASEDGSDRQDIKRICNKTDKLPLPKGRYDFGWTDPCSEAPGGYGSESMLHYLAMKKFGKERLCEAIENSQQSERPNFYSMSMAELTAYRIKLNGYLEVHQYVADQAKLAEKTLKADQEVDKKRPKDSTPE